jgi:hypothetical protein
MAIFWSSMDGTVPCISIVFWKYTGLSQLHCLFGSEPVWPWYTGALQENLPSACQKGSMTSYKDRTLESQTWSWPSPLPTPLPHVTSDTILMSP